MPISTNNAIVERYNQLRDALAAKQAALNAIPEGSARTCAQLECEFTRVLLEKFDRLDEFDTVRDGSAPFQELAAPEFAALYFVRKAAENNEQPTAEEIRRRAEALAADPRFREAVMDVMDNDGILKMMECLPGGSQTEHLMKWGDEITSGGIDYETYFDEHTVNMTPAEREEAHRNYTTLKAISDMAKLKDYSKGQTPEQLFDFATNPTLAENYGIESATAVPVMNRLARVQQAGQFPSTLPTRRNMPSSLNRIFAGFLEYPVSEDANVIAAADERNRTVMTKLCEPGKPGDDYRKEFMTNMINRMLALKDEDLNPATMSQASEFYKKNMAEVEGLFEMPNFLSALNVDGFMLPQNVEVALKHKSLLVQQNLVAYRDSFRSAADENYRARAMAKDWPGQFVCEIAGKEIKLNKIPANVRMSLAVWGASNFRDVNAARTRTEVNPAYDNKSLSADMIVRTKEPPLPKTSHRVLHFLFGAYKKEFEQYERDCRNARNARSELARRKAALGTQNDLDRMNTNERLFRTDENQAGIGRAADAAVANKDQITANAKAEYQTKLDGAFSEIERQSGGAYSRLDYIVIGGRTMRALLQEEYLTNHPDEDFKETESMQNFVRESVENGHVNDILLDAQLHSHNVTIYRPNPETGRLVLDDHGRPDFRLATPEAVTSLGDSGQNAYANAVGRLTNVNFATADNARERIVQANNCRAAVLQHNAVNMAQMYLPDSNKMKENLTGPALRERNMTAEEFSNASNSVYRCTRSSLESLVAAKLAADNHMTVEQIFDPNFEPETKKQAALEVIDLCKKPNPMDQALVNEKKLKLASISYRGQNILTNYVDEKLAGVDITNPAQLYAPSRAYVTGVSAMVFDLDQDSAQHINSQMKQFVMENVIPETEEPMPYAQKDTIAQAELDRLRDGALNIGWLKKATPCTSYACELVAGCVPGGNVFLKERLLGNEAHKSAVVSAMAAGKPMSRAFTFAEAYSFESIGIIPEEGNRRGAVTNPDEARARLNTEDAKKASEFGLYVLSGSLAKDCKVKPSGNRAEPLKLTLTKESQKTAANEHKLHQVELGGAQGPARQ